MKKAASLIAAAAITLTGCSRADDTEYHDLTPSSPSWNIGFAYEEIIPPETSSPLYIAGYNSGVEIDGILDYQRANAVWLDAGGDGILLIEIDCVAISNENVNKIRNLLADFCRETGCAAVNVAATHDHAGIDTFGLWGEVAAEGKNPEFSAELIECCVKAAGNAYNDRRSGELYYGTIKTENMLRDSRDPQVYDETMYQLRFVPDDGSPALRMISYTAHAESLRGANTALSRDYPGRMSDTINEQTGDRTIFMPTTVGGLLMTKEFIEPFDAVENMHYTGDRLAEYALNTDNWQIVEPSLSYARTGITVPLDNTAFMYYRFLGILDNKTAKGDGETGYSLISEMSLIKIGNISYLLIPGELFPELLIGGYDMNIAASPEYENPVPIAETAKKYGIENLIVIGLANDELGYIIPPYDFILNKDAPYLTNAYDALNRRHYEETNSCGRHTAEVIADGAEKLFEAVKKQ